MTYTGSKYIEDDYISIARGHVKKADIDVRAQVRSNNARITAAFDLILFKGTR